MSSRYLWLILVISILAACGSLVYISLFFGNHYQSNRGNLKEFFNKPEKLTEEKCVPVCDSKECVIQAKLVLSRMDPAADPCENTFDFSCGKYTDPFTEHEGNTFASQLFLDMQLRLKNVLENIDAGTESTSGKMKIVYDTCIKQSSSDIHALPVFLQQLADFGIPHWPNLPPDFKFTNPNLTVTMVNFIKYEEYGFIDVDVKKYPRKVPQINATIRIAEATYEKKEKSLRKYWLDKALHYFNMDSERIIQIWEESEAVYDAISHLKEESERIHSEKENPSSRYNYWDCVLDADITMKPVCEIVELFVDSANVSSGINKRFLRVPGESTYFMQNLNHVLSCFSDTSIANYLAVNMLLKHLEELNFYFRLAFQKDPDSISRDTGMRLGMGHWQHCVEWLTENMFLPLLYELRKQVFTMSVLEEIENLIQESIEQTASIVPNQEWIGESQRVKLTQEIEALTNSIHEVKHLPNETVLNSIYDKFHPMGGSFMRNIFEYQRFLKVEKMHGLLTTANLHIFRSQILRPGASGGGDSLTLRMGIFLPPVFRIGLTRILNLISFAAVGVHEIGHSIEFFSYPFKEDAATKEYLDKFNECIVNQFSQFRFDFIEENLNGTKYIRENLADTIAISIIDKFIERYSSEDNAILLPAFPYSPKRLLYLSAIQIWCEAYTRKDEEINHLEDIHSPGKFRLLGMSQNSKGFSEAFSCSEDSFMNPSTKCLFFV